MATFVFAYRMPENYTPGRPAGYSLVAGDDLQAAVALARGCPVLAEGGGVEVGERSRS